MRRLKLLSLLAALAVSLSFSSPALAEEAVYQQGQPDPFSGTAYDGMQDTVLWLNASTGNASNGGGRGNITVGPGGSPPRVWHRRSLMRFDLSSLRGRYRQLNSVTLRLHERVASGHSSLNKSGAVQVHVVTPANRNWVEGTAVNGAQTGSASWDWKRNYQARWAGSKGAGKAGTDYVSTPIGVEPWAPADTVLEIEFTDLSALDDWMDGGSNAGILLRAQNEGAVSRWIAHSSESTTASLRPELIIDYDPMPAADPALSEIEADASSLPSFGSATITVTPRDAQGSLLGSGALVEISTTSGILVGDVEDQGDGTYTQELKVGLGPRDAVVTARVLDVELDSEVTLEVGAEEVELITNGDFEAGFTTVKTPYGRHEIPDGWKEKVSLRAGELSTIRNHADNGPSAPGETCMRWWRNYSGLTGDHDLIQQDLSIDAADYTELRLSLDVMVERHNLDGGGDPRYHTEWPAKVTILYTRASDGKNQVWRHGFYVSPPGDGTVFDPGSGIISETKDTRVTPYEWHTATFDLSEELPDLGEIQWIRIGGAGWKYWGRGDNVSIRGVPANVEPPDSEAPDVTITSPAADAVIGVSTVDVTAAVDDASATEVASTPAGVSGSLPSGGGTVSGTVSLDSDGEHTISVSAEDEFGNVGGTSVTVIRDTAAPAVTVLSPAGGSLLGESPATVTVEVSDLTATTVDLAGAQVSLPAGGGTASVSVTLVEGTNTLDIEVTDAAGNSTPKTLVLKLDTTAPLVRIDTPAEGACFGPGDSPLALTATVDDASATTVTSSPSGISTTLPEGGGVVTGVVALAEGTNTLVVTATDGTGRTGQDSVMVVLDTTPPDLSFLSPGDGDPVRGTIDVGFSATDPAPGSGVDRVELSVDGTLEATLAAPFETQIDTTALSDGWHTLTAKAVDGKGNSRTVEVSVLVDNAAPAVSVTGITEGDIVGGTITLGYSVSDGTSGVSEATLTVGGIAPSTDPSSVYAMPVSGDAQDGSEATTRWPDGEIQVVARAVDAAGNEAEHVVTITLDNTNPEKMLASPTDGSVVSGTISLEATASDAHLTGIRILVDGVEVASSTTSPLTASYDTTTRLDGEMEVVAIATDAAGNESRCPATVTVDNMSVEFKPSSLNLKAKGGAPVFAELTAPNLSLLLPTEDHTLTLLVPGGSPVSAETGWDGDDELSGPDGTKLKIRFPRAALSAAIQAGIDNGSIPENAQTTEVTLTADGHVIGAATVRLKTKGGKK